MSAIRPILSLLFLASSGLCAQTPNPWLLPNFSDRVELFVSNPSEQPLDSTVVLPLATAAKIAPGFPGTLAVVMLPGQNIHAIPSQADDLDGDGVPDEFVFPANLKPHESITVEIYYSTTLHDVLPWPAKTFASHSFGYNTATAALESEKIGYRTYGGFFLDVQARRAGYPGLDNSLVGYLSARRGKDSTVGRDIFHAGDTLGLGGLFLRSGTSVFRPPLNVPDYAHLPAPAESPTYRVIATGPVRAVIHASMAHWTIGPDSVKLDATYTIDANSEVVNCRFRVTPLSLTHAYEVGAGIRELPKMQQASAVGLLALEGEQSEDLGRLALALYFDPNARPGSLQTPDGANHVAVFQTRLTQEVPVSGSYSVAAAWSGSGIKSPLEHLHELNSVVRISPVVSGLRHSTTPAPQRLTGEAN